jgi:hypothetical protein
VSKSHAYGSDFSNLKMTSVVLERIQAQAQAYLNNNVDNPRGSIKEVTEPSRLVSNIVTLAGDSRVHVAVSAFPRDPGCDYDCRRWALSAQRSTLDAQRPTFADRHLFIQALYLQVVPVSTFRSAIYHGPIYVSPSLDVTFLDCACSLCQCCDTSNLLESGTFRSGGCG